MILVAVPVLNRPERVSFIVQSFLEAKTVESRLMFVCSPGDTNEIAECMGWAHHTGIEHRIVDWSPGRGDYARKINYAVTHSDEPWIFMGADDLCFCPGWDQKALDCAAQARVGVIGTNDLGNPRVTSGRHATHNLVSRAYIQEFGTIDEPGKMLHEGYDHNFCDDELVGTAQHRGQWVFCETSEVPHLHPNWQKGHWDATYTKGVREFNQDNTLFYRRRPLWLNL